MSDLSPEARALLKAGRDGWRATESDRVRVLGKLSAATGLAAAGGAGASSSRIVRRVLEAVRPPLHWPLIGLPVVACGIALWGVKMRSPAASGAAALPRDAIEAPAVAAPPDNPFSLPTAQAIEGPAQPVVGTVSDRLQAPPAPSNVTRRGDHPAVRAGSRDQLQEEVALLSKAEAELYDGRARQALDTLDEHERRFRSGALAEERIAARIRALCALGRLSEADAELGRLARASARSPYLDRAREACERARDHQ